MQRSLLAIHEIPQLTVLFQGITTRKILWTILVHAVKFFRTVERHLSLAFFFLFLAGVVFRSSVQMKGTSLNADTFHL